MDKTFSLAKTDLAAGVLKIEIRQENRNLVRSIVNKRKDQVTELIETINHIDLEKLKILDWYILLESLKIKFN